MTKKCFRWLASDALRRDCGWQQKHVWVGTLIHARGRIWIEIPRMRQRLRPKYVRQQEKQKWRHAGSLLWRYHSLRHLPWNASLLCGCGFGISRQWGWIVKQMDQKLGKLNPDVNWLHKNYLENLSSIFAPQSNVTLTEAVYLSNSFGKFHGIMFSIDNC